MGAQHRAARLLTVAVVVMGTACARGGSRNDQPERAAQRGTETTSAVPGSASLPTTGDAALPLDSYVADAAQRREIDRAVNLLVRDCMKTKGFDYVVAEEASRATRRKQPYGITDPGDASRYGYHDPQIESGEKKFSTERPPDAYLVALQGFARPPQTGAPPAGGCLQEAQTALGSSDTNGAVDLDLVGRLAEHAGALTASDPRVAEAERAWSQCMARRGFSYRTPAEPLSAAWPAEPDAREIATAIADVACKTEVDLPQVWHRAEADHQQRLVDQHAAQLEEVRRALEARVRQVREVLEGRR